MRVRFFNPLRLFLNSINPIHIYREERRLDREANLFIAKEIGDAIKANSDVAIRAIDMANKFIDSFKVDEEPESRVVRNEDEIAQYMKQYGMKKEDFEDSDPFTPIF